MQWSEQFATGHPLVDEQHRLLIFYISRLGNIPLTTNPSREEVEFFLGLVDFVQTYTLYHFQHEEACMDRHHCPAQRENKDRHREFLAFFNHFKRRFENDGYRPELAKELYSACRALIEDHILRVDMKLKGCRAVKSCVGEE